MWTSTLERSSAASSAAPSPITPPSELSADALAEKSPGCWRRVVDAVEQWYCGLKGHDYVKSFEDHRIALKCPSCRYVTPGWDVKPAPERAGR
jgi:hypothetical protein